VGRKNFTPPKILKNFLNILESALGMQKARAMGKGPFCNIFWGERASPTLQKPKNPPKPRKSSKTPKLSKNPENPPKPRKPSNPQKKAPFPFLEGNGAF
jgi:hypothetical protein